MVVSNHRYTIIAPPLSNSWIHRALVITSHSAGAWYPGLHGNEAVQGSLLPPAHDRAAPGKGGRRDTQGRPQSRLEAAPSAPDEGGLGPAGHGLGDWKGQQVCQIWEVGDMTPELAIIIRLFLL